MNVQDIMHNCLRTVWLCTVFTVRQWNILHSVKCSSGIIASLNRAI